MNSLQSEIAVLIYSWILASVAVHGLDAPDVVFVVLSQSDTYHASLAQQLKTSIRGEASQGEPVIHLVPEDFPHPGAWTVIPLISELNELHGSNSSWIVFCESHTSINLPSVLLLLNKYNSTQEVFLGHALHDREATIIHHFAFSEDPEQFKYPNFACGFAISQALLQRLAFRLVHHDLPDIDFSIDASHELALYIWDNGKGPVLAHSPQLCLREEPQCASYPTKFKACEHITDSIKNKVVPKESMYFAVKTCGKFHKDRIPVVKDTWAKYTSHIGFYSELEDTSIPTINLGIPNTEHGHCGKTMAIFKHVAGASIPDVRWVIIVDDDTILSVARLQQYLSCFDADKPIAIGERYGYNVMHVPDGYNYITGGGGMVFSLTAVKQIADSNFCKCPSISTPDDMFLGICLSRLNIPIIHSALFHQARPLDYAPEYLAPQLVVSFHKHWMIDPHKVYKKWFSRVDQEMEAQSQGQKHVEL